MNKLTIWRRLNPSLASIILLLIVAAGLVVWVEHIQKDADKISDEFTSDAAKVRLRLEEMNDALRGLMLDPKSKPDHDRWEETKGDLVTNLVGPNESSVLKRYQRFYKTSNTKTASTPLGKSVSKLFGIVNDLNNSEVNLVSVQATDPNAAINLYRQSYGPKLDARTAALTDFDQRISDVQTNISNAADIKSLIIRGVAILLLVIAVFVGAHQSSSITEPLSQLVETLERMRHGDFTKRLNIRRRDEFGVLADGLNRLVDDLSVLVGQVQRSGIQVNTNATEIAATARQQQSTANEIAATTAQIGATSKQISATSKELVKTMSEVNGVAEQTEQVAANGQEAISSMENTMRQIMDASGSISSKLAVLSERTANINSVVTTITKV